MKPKLRFLMLEDETADAELIQKFLRRSGMNFTAAVASDRPEFIAAISTGPFDAILADNSLPQFDSIDALKLLQSENIDSPFILVTGTVSEEFAVGIIQMGADDYILKNNLTRLPSSILQAIEKRKITKEKQDAEEDLRQSNRELHELSLHLQNIREEERIQIARDIHDELGQQLTGLKMDVYALDKQIDSDDITVRGKFTDILVMIEEIVGSVRKIAANLRTNILDDLGLVAALKWQSKEVENRFGIKINFACDFPEIDTPVGISTGMFRIYQEALTNAVRHANAHVIECSLKVANHRLIMDIHDDGKGIEECAGGKRKSFGLLGIKERVFVMGGEYTLNSAPGKGTSLTISVPV
jgi:signal transduction histidine kinase